MERLASRWPGHLKVSSFAIVRVVGKTQAHLTPLIFSLEILNCAGCLENHWSPFIAYPKRATLEAFVRFVVHRCQVCKRTERYSCPLGVLIRMCHSGPRGIYSWTAGPAGMRVWKRFLSLAPFQPSVLGRFDCNVEQVTQTAT